MGQIFDLSNAMSSHAQTSMQGAPIFWPQCIPKEPVLSVKRRDCGSLLCAAIAIAIVMVAMALPPKSHHEFHAMGQKLCEPSFARNFQMQSCVLPATSLFMKSVKIPQFMEVRIKITIITRFWFMCKVFASRDLQNFSACDIKTFRIMTVCIPSSRLQQHHGS